MTFSLAGEASDVGVVIGHVDDLYEANTDQGTKGEIAQKLLEQDCKLILTTGWLLGTKFKTYIDSRLTT